MKSRNQIAWLIGIKKIKKIKGLIDRDEQNLLKIL
jgi:hypothetical protein